MPTASRRKCASYVSGSTPVAESSEPYFLLNQRIKEDQQIPFQDRTVLDKELWCKDSEFNGADLQDAPVAREP